MTCGLTRRQRDLLEFLRARPAASIPPSYEAMRVALGLASKSGIIALLRGLEERGYIRRLPYRARSIQLVDPGAPVEQLRDALVTKIEEMPDRFAFTRAEIVNLIKETNP